MADVRTATPAAERFAQAQAAFVTGDLRSAARLVANLPRELPRSPEAHALYAEIAARGGDPARAEQAFARALQLRPDDATISARFAIFLRRSGDPVRSLEHYRRSLAAAPEQSSVRLEFGLALDEIGEPDRAIEQLTELLRRSPDNVAAWQVLGAICREMSDGAAAERCFEQAVGFATDDVLARRSLALTRAERGMSPDLAFPAGTPATRELRLAEASARFNAGEADRAIAMAEALAADDPAWLDAQRTLAELRFQAEGGEGFARGFEASLARDPAQGPMWATYLRLLGRAGRHADVVRGAADARHALGESATLDLLEARAASLIGEHARADVLLGRLAAAPPEGAQIEMMSHLLRTHRPEAAARLAEPLLEGALGPHIFPFVGTAWRLLEDPRWAWLEGDDRLVSAIDLDLDLAALGDLLRHLHRARFQPIEQSLRGGTQTDGPLLMRAEPEIAAMRQSFESAIAQHIAQLPPPDPRHPTLGPLRGPARFTGCWSVRLTGAGFHVNHMHSDGWMSSAFYVALPDSIGRGGEERAGWLVFGQPPADLGLDLPPVRAIEPRPGRLALFPSTMWHGTLPFDGGERLTVAFDVVPRSSGLAGV